MATQPITLQTEQRFKKTPLGEIPIDWETAQLKELGEIFTGGTPSTKSPKFWGGPFMFVTPTDITDEPYIRSTARHVSTAGLELMNKIPRNAVMVTCIASIGKIALASQNCCTNQQINSIVCSNNIVPKFLYYILKSRINLLKSLAGQTAVPIINKSSFGEISVPLAPMVEQKKIADVLSAMDEAIEKTDAVIQKTKELKKGFLQNFITMGLDDNSINKKTIFGQCPQNWRLVKLSEICNKIQDGTHFSPKSKAGPYMYVTSKNVRMGQLNLNNVSYILEEEHNEIYQRADIKYGDVLITKDGVNAGNIAINTIQKPFSLLSSVAFLRPNPEVVIAEWIYQFYASDLGNTYVKNQVSGLAITRLTLDKINKLEILLPPLHEQKKIADILSAVDEQIEKEEQGKKRFEQTKKALMNVLVTGKVRVAEETRIKVLS